MIHSELVGTGDRVVVFLHGLNLDHRSLKQLCEPAFTQRADLKRVYFDLPGHGATPATAPERTSADDWIDMFVAAIRQITADEVRIVGHGYGAYLAQALASRVPTAGLALVCPVVEPDFARRSVPAPRAMAEPTGGALVFEDELERQLFDEGALPRTAECLERFRAQVMTATRGVDREMIARLRDRYAASASFYSGLAEVIGSSVIVCARDDHWNGYRDALALVPHLPRASYHVLADLGPYAIVEAPDSVRAPIWSWVQQIR